MKSIEELRKALEKLDVNNPMAFSLPAEALDDALDELEAARVVLKIVHTWNAVGALKVALAAYDEITGGGK